MLTLLVTMTLSILHDASAAVRGNRHRITEIPSGQDIKVGHIDMDNYTCHTSEIYFVKFTIQVNIYATELVDIHVKKADMFGQKTN